MTTDTDITQEHPSHISTMSTERKSLSKFLIGFAWAFEIIAVTIGLAISLSTLLANFQEMESYRQDGINFADMTNMFIAAVPFVMISVVEITKIPLVGAFYKSTAKSWRVAFAACLVFVAILTFESAMNGFERNFSVLMTSIDGPKKELVTVDQKLEKLENDRTELQSLTLKNIEKDYNDRYDDLFTASENQKSGIQNQINHLRASIKTEHIESMKTELENARSDRQRLYEEQDRELTRLTNDYSSKSTELSDDVSAKRRSLQNQVHSAGQELSRLRQKAEKEIEDASFFTVDNSRKRWESVLKDSENRLQELRRELNSLGATSSLSQVRGEEQQVKDRVRNRFAAHLSKVDKKISKLSQDISKSIGSKEQEIETLVTGYQAQFRQVDAEFQEQLALNQKQREERVERFNNNATLIDNLDSEINDLHNNHIQLISDINQKVGTNQIYRIATWATNKDNAAEVERDDVFLVALLWFGSLSALIALMGIFLALASYVIGDETIPNRGEEKGNRDRHKFYRALRRYYVYKKKGKMTRTEFVERDRVVFKEIPVETIRKEFVHIPFYTNDKRLLNMAEKMEKGEAKGHEKVADKPVSAV